MSFGLDKYGYIVPKRRKVIRTEEVEILEGKIAYIQERYKYHVILQTSRNQDESKRRSATAKNLQRVRL